MRIRLRHDRRAARRAAAGRTHHRADVPGHEAGRASSRASTAWASASRGRRARRRAQSVRQQPRRRPESHRADRELADGDLHQEGQAFDATGRSLYGPVNDQQRVQGLRRRVRGAQQRRRRRPLRSARRPLADRDADLLARSAERRRRAAGQSARRRRPDSSRRPDRRSSAGRGRRAASNRRSRRPRRRRRRRAQRGSRRASRRAPPPPGTVLDVLRGQHRARSARHRTTATSSERPLFPDYPRPADLARRLLRPDEHQRQPHLETIATQKHACVVDRAKMLKGEPATEQCVIVDDVNFLNNADIDGKALPPAGAPNIMMAAGGTQLDKIFEDDGIDVWKFHVDWKTPSKTKLDRPGEDRGRAVSLPVRRPADELRAAAGHRPPARRAGRQDHGAPRLPAHRRPRIDRRRALGQHRRRRRRRALVRVPGRQDSASVVALSAGHLRARAASTAGWRARRWTTTATSASATRSAATPHFAGQRFAGRLAGDPPGQLTLRRDGAGRGRGVADDARCAGRTTRRRPSIRPTTARSGTSATTSRRTRRATRRASARSACRGAADSDDLNRFHHRGPRGEVECAAWARSPDCCWLLPPSARWRRHSQGTRTPPAYQGADPPQNAVWVDSLDLSNAPIRRPRPQRGQTAAAPLVFRLSGVTYAHGVPLLSDGDLAIDLAGGALRFVAMVGIDDGQPQAGGASPGGTATPPPPAGSVVFGAWLDGRKVFESDVMHRGDTPRPVSINLAGARTLVLAVVDANDGTAGDTAEWSGAAIVAKPGQQSQVRVAPAVSEAPPAIAFEPDRSADDQLPANHRRHAGTPVSVPYSGVRHRGARLQCAQSSRRPCARPAQRHHPRIAEEGRADRRRCHGAEHGIVTASTRFNPLWILLIGGCLGFAGVI